MFGVGETVKTVDWSCIRNAPMAQQSHWASCNNTICCPGATGCALPEEPVVSGQWLYYMIGALPCLGSLTLRCLYTACEGAGVAIYHTAGNQGNIQKLLTGHVIVMHQSQGRVIVHHVVIQDVRECKYVYINKLRSRYPLAMFYFTTCSQQPTCMYGGVS